jgi:hypothetical protein
MNVRGMSNAEFKEWCGWTRGQACAVMLANGWTILPARAMAPGAKMSVSDPGKVWVENFQKPLSGMWKSSAVYCGTYGEIG